MLPVYADLWLHKAAPLEAINHALEEMLDEISVPQSAVGKMSKTTPPNERMQDDEPGEFNGASVWSAWGAPHLGRAWD